ncbi:MAG: carbamoyltransferase HypF, partial [Pirellula sp.]
GALDAIDAFRESLRLRFPSAKQDVHAEKGFQPRGRFQILESVSEGAVRFVIPRDRVTCEECLHECQTPGDRRFGFALNGCAQCGPRYSLITAMPYDRRHTSMSEFVMCAGCQAEFENPNHRRFHAQTNSCPECGPKVWYEANGELIGHGETAVAAAIAAAARDICQGRILALKGLGGYQLVCDATNRAVVDRLRSRKGRISKPLAVMTVSVHAALSIAEIDALEENALKSPAGPIVLVRSKQKTCLASNIHAGFCNVGMMLPTTALHMMLLNETKVPLVVTSGNIEGEPLEYRETEATLRLAGIVDCFLHHNRPIVHPIDDSVVQSIAGQLVTLRAARGIAPIPVDYSPNLQVMSLGGQQKSAIAFSNGHSTVLGPDLGDLNTVRSRERFLNQKTALQNLLNCESPVFACDQHPDYFSTQWATENSTRECHSIQHHHAHVVSAMVEHGWLGRTVLGFAFDGTGLGTDGTIWGGEVLVANATSFRRVGSLRQFRLVGGDVAAEQPWRTALSLLVDALGRQKALETIDSSVLSHWHVDCVMVANVAQLLQSESASRRTSSMGRLFDGVAALVCGIGHSSFEGEAAMRLEAICDLEVKESYPFSVEEESPFELDWRPMIQGLVADLESHVPAGIMAMKFHRAVSECIATIALRFPDLSVVLAGGVFQNRTLVELVDRQFRNQSTPYAMPCLIPPNDGGLAIGQLAIAATRIEGAVCV